MAETLVFWPDCRFPGCRNKCCMALESPLCHPHSILKLIFDNNEQTDPFIQSELARLFEAPCTG